MYRVHLTHGRTHGYTEKRMYPMPIIYRFFPEKYFKKRSEVIISITSSWTNRELLSKFNTSSTYVYNIIIDAILLFDFNIIYIAYIAYNNMIVQIIVL